MITDTSLLDAKLAVWANCHVGQAGQGNFTNLPEDFVVESADLILRFHLGGIRIVRRDLGRRSEACLFAEFGENLTNSKGMEFEVQLVVLPGHFHQRGIGLNGSPE